MKNKKYQDEIKNSSCTTDGEGSIINRKGEDNESTSDRFLYGKCLQEYYGSGCAHDAGPASESFIQHCGPDVYRQDPGSGKSGAYGSGDLFSGHYVDHGFYLSVR